MATLELSYSGKRLENFPIGMGDTFMIGRQNANDIVIDNLAVSFHHAKIESIGDEFLLIDLHSENGTFVNERRIKAHWLSDGDLITIGKHTLRFACPLSQGLPDALSPSIIETMQMDTRRFRELLKKNGLKAAAGADARNAAPHVLAFLTERRKELPLGDRPVRIGREKTADIVVRGLFVAATAAVINRLEDGWYISRVGGLARVKVNGEAVRSAVKLNRLDIVSLARTKMQFLVRP
ncbi:MAG: FHA domain-containing protein [Desulfobacterales bacterium]|jgi:pSer/pThr/pTyr-binding forkhead associated (FHA) protein|nr:FHA domain-containing protein [Desulfobacterales bacterium]MCU0561779.1 FHA domain-containing protein [Desulfobacterales bacterium]